VEIKVPENQNFDKSWAVTGTKGQRKHNIINSLFLDPASLEKQNEIRFERYKEIEENEVMYESYMMDDAEVCVVAFGIAARVAKNAIVEARKNGVKVGLIRPITLWPFPSKVLAEAAKTCCSFVSVELSMGQMIEDVRAAVKYSRPVSLCSRTGGIIPSPEEVYHSIIEAAKNGGDKK